MSSMNWLQRLYRCITGRYLLFVERCVYCHKFISIKSAQGLKRRLGDPWRLGVVVSDGGICKKCYAREMAQLERDRTYIGIYAMR